MLVVLVTMNFEIGEDMKERLLRISRRHSSESRRRQSFTPEVNKPSSGWFFAGKLGKNFGTGRCIRYLRPAIGVLNLICFYLLFTSREFISFISNVHL